MKHRSNSNRAARPYLSNMAQGIEPFLFTSAFSFPLGETSVQKVSKMTPSNPV